ncbi:MAG: indolepyruvate oxidoreductase subunit beta [Treponema sp.]|jgi:indolepyruvate ferredoxin oxidoreductase beta subunit|nr:indolepyruvate oxidoreductase subunit beta [Treponema sp.]
MNCDCILSGVGGQGVLSIAAIIAHAAVKSGCTVRQSEVHGMAQRGGAVLAHLRIAGGPIAGDLVPRGAAHLVVSMEPLESLRYLPWLSPDGALVTAAEPFVNIPDYPEPGIILAAVEKLPRGRAVPAAALAKEAGLARAVNMVMVGAASPYLPVTAEILEETIGELFAAKNPEANIRAFRAGRNASGETR